MKKTLTITFHSPTNNGSFLQAYALQQVLINKCNVENKIIDFQSDKQKRLYSLFRPIHSKIDVVKNMVSLLHLKKLKARQKNFEKMQKSYLHLTETISKEDDVYEIAKSADLNIVGSDQVWNTKALDFSSAYFLPNVNAKKITYAVSCGSKATAELLSDYQEYINDFSNISVREESVKSILNCYANEIEVSCDPTLLLNKEDYFPLFDKKPLINGEYIFLYSMSYNEEILKTAQKLSKEFQIPVVTPFTTYSTVKSKKYGMKILYDACPSDFLNLVYNAKFVLTNSFHGTAFSIIFEKNFYHVCEKSAEGLYKRDDRIDDLLDYLELDRNICFDTDINFIKNNLCTNYESAHKRLTILKEKSINYLKENTEN